jgi:hypothetical protein
VTTEGFLQVMTFPNGAGPPPAEGPQYGSGPDIGDGPGRHAADDTSRFGHQPSSQVPPPGSWWGPAPEPHAEPATWQPDPPGRASWQPSRRDQPEPMLPAAQKPVDAAAQNATRVPLPRRPDRRPGGRRPPFSGPADAGRRPRVPAGSYAQADPSAAAEPLTDLQRALPDLRTQMIDRLVALNWNQAQEAWRRRRRDPLSAHVLVFFFHGRLVGEPPRAQLMTAMRILPAGAESARMPLMLNSMTVVVHKHLDGGLPPDKTIFSSSDPRTVDARYLATAVSTLDTPAASWDQVQRTAANDMEIPGRCYVHLNDGSELLIARMSQSRLFQSTVLSTAAVSGQQRTAVRHVRQLGNPDYIPGDDPVEAEEQLTWQQLAQLHDAMRKVDHVR